MYASKKSSLIQRGHYALERLTNRATSRLLTMTSGLINSDIGIATAGFNGNLGDQALLRCLESAIQVVGLKSNALDYTQAAKGAIASRPLIMGGGELGDNYHFETISRIQPNPHYCTAIGISPANTFLQTPAPALIDYLREVPKIFVRNKSGARSLGALLGSSNVNYAPDITFSIYDEPWMRERLSARTNESTRKRKILGINVVPFYLSYTRNGTFKESTDLAQFLALSSPNFDLTAAAKGYIESIQEIVRFYSAKGYLIRYFPFSLPDEIFGSLIDPFAPRRTVKCRGSFLSAIEKIATCDLFIASRFHAHIAAMIAGVPLISIGTSSKNIRLMNDLSLPSGVPREEFQSPISAIALLKSAERILVEPKTMLALGNASRTAILDSINALIANSLK